MSKGKSINHRHRISGIAILHRLRDSHTTRIAATQYVINITGNHRLLTIVVKKVIDTPDQSLGISTYRCH